MNCIAVVTMFLALSAKSLKLALQSALVHVEITTVPHLQQRSHSQPENGSMSAWPVLGI